MKIVLQRKEFLKTTVWISLLAVGIIIYYQKLYGIFLLSDGLFLSGLFFFCMGLFRFVCHLGLFDSMIYGTKRLFGSTKQDFVEYIQSNPHEKSYLETLLVSILFMILSFIF